MASPVIFVDLSISMINTVSVRADYLRILLTTYRFCPGGPCAIQPFMLLDMDSQVCFSRSCTVPINELQSLRISFGLWKERNQRRTGSWWMIQCGQSISLQMVTPEFEMEGVIADEYQELYSVSTTHLPGSDMQSKSHYGSYSSPI